MCSDIRQLTQQGVLRVKLGKFQKASSVTYLLHQLSVFVHTERLVFPYAQKQTTDQQLI